MVQGREEIGFVDCTLSGVALWKLKIVKQISANAQPAENNTDRGVCQVIGHDGPSASRDLSDRRVTESELLKQESVLAEHAGDLFRTLERRDRVSLGIAVVRL